jgi:Cu+-exporting ATPase
MKTFQLQLQGMGGAAGATNIEKAIQTVPGVADCNVNFGREFVIIFT